jgi:23S rRNA pseudouridine1911/1915/1917 synthase
VCSHEPSLEACEDSSEWESRHFVVEQSPAKPRLDAWLHTQCPAWSRGLIRRWIEAGAILVDEKPTKPSHPLRAGQRIAITPPPPASMELIPEPMALDILFEDEVVLVINKPPGLVVHPAAGHTTGTLVHGVLHHCQGSLSGIGGVARPGVVHRLDQDTSGCLVMAKTDAAHQSLSEQFAQRTTTKHYLAIACGLMPHSRGRIEAPIARHPTQRKTMAVMDHGRKAITDYQVIQSFGTQASCLNLTLHTGRTHQIRVHLKHLGHPVFGDETYGQKATHRLASALGHCPERQQLHAWKLGFAHPITGERLMHVAPPPEDIHLSLEALARGNDTDLISITP